MNINLLIKGRREKLGLTLRDLAQKANVSPTLISNLENGVFDPKWSNVLSIANSLGVEIQAVEDGEMLRLEVTPVSSKQVEPA